MMRYLIVLEPTADGFAVQVPDLAVITYGQSIDEAKRAAVEAIKINLAAYRQAGKKVPAAKPAATHLKNPDFADLLFAYVEVGRQKDKLVA
jgi:predicted RNase H-like HicB family nuclease